MSMVGYLRAGSPDRRPLEDLVRLLPEIAGQNDRPIAFKTFASVIETLPAARIREAEREEFYRCPPGSGRDCDSSRTSLDRVIDEIGGQPPASLAFVVSDLWPGDPGNRTSAHVALQRGFARIFDSGRSVAVYGIKAPFAGRITDLPPPLAGVAIRSTHPLYLVAIGPTEALRDVYRRLRASSSQFIREGLQNEARGDAFYALFTHTPLVAVAEGEGPQADPSLADPSLADPSRAASEATTPATFEGTGATGLATSRGLSVQPGLELAQFALDAGDATSAEEPPQPRAWRSGHQGLRGAVWDGRLQPATTTWFRTAAACDAGAWEVDEPLRDAWSGEGARQTFALRPAALAERYGAGGTYLISGSLTPAFAADRPRPASRWMRDWSLSAETAVQEAAAASSAPMFRTLYLAEMEQMLATQLAESARRHARPADGFTIALEVTP